METISYPKNLENLTNLEIYNITQHLSYELNRIKNHMESRQEEENQNSISIPEPEICHCPHSLRRMHPQWDCPYSEDRPLQICHTLVQEEEDYEDQGYNDGHESEHEDSNQGYQPDYEEEDDLPQDPNEECQMNCGEQDRHSISECPQNNYPYEEDEH